MRNVKYKMSEYTVDQSYTQPLDLTGESEANDTRASHLSDNINDSTISMNGCMSANDSDVEKLCGEHNEYLFLLRQVVEQSSDLIQQWVPARYCADRMPTLKMLEHAKTAIERVSICLMALRDVPESERYKCMGIEEKQLTQQFLDRLDKYLNDQNMATMF